MNYEYNTTEHTFFLLIIALPLFVKLTSLIPTILLKLMNKYKTKLHNSFKMLLSYGYLYKEYNKECYYWEIVKIV